jgi:hypothetical protein
MIRVCMFCGMVFGEKEPLYDKRQTHGICAPCFEEFRVNYENQEEVEQKGQIWGTTQIKSPVVRFHQN